MEKLKLTKEDVQIINLVKSRFPKPKPKAKTSGGNKKTEQQTFLGKLISGADKSRNNLVAESDPEKKRKLLADRMKSFKKLCNDLALADADEATVTNIVKKGLAVLLDVRTVPESKTETKPESSPSVQPSN